MFLFGKEKEIWGVPEEEGGFLGGTSPMMVGDVGKETLPKRELGAIGSEVQLGLIKPEGENRLLFSSDGAWGGRAKKADDGAVGGGYFNNSIWGSEAGNKGSENQSGLSMSCLSASAKPGGRGGADDGWPFGFGFDGKENVAPSFGGSGIRIGERRTQTPIGLHSTTMDLDSAFGRKNDEAGGGRGGGGGYSGGLKTHPFFGESVNLNRSSASSSFPGATGESYWGRPSSENNNEAYLLGYLAGQRSVSAPVTPRHPGMMLGGADIGPRNVYEEARKKSGGGVVGLESGFWNPTSSLPATPTQQQGRKPLFDDLSNKGETAMLEGFRQMKEPNRSDTAGYGTAPFSKAKRTYSNSSLRSEPPLAGGGREGVGGSGGQQRSSRVPSWQTNRNKEDMQTFIDTYGYGQGEERASMLMRPRKGKYFKAFNV